MEGGGGSGTFAHTPALSSLCIEEFSRGASSLKHVCMCQSSTEVIVCVSVYVGKRTRPRSNRWSRRSRVMMPVPFGASSSFFLCAHHVW